MRRIEQLGLVESLKLLLPRFLTAGATVRRIQTIIRTKNIRQTTLKSGDHFSNPLTDATRLVQSLFGMAVGELFTDASFYTEENREDRISRYLLKDAPFLITLDPLDGTLFFQDGLANYDIILTICRQGKLVAAVDYRPATDMFYLGITGVGAFTTSAKRIHSGLPWAKFSLARTPKTVLTYCNDPHVSARITRAGLQVVGSEDYKLGSGIWDFPLHGILTGEIGGLYRTDAPLIDWVALAFIAQLAGGAWNDPPIRDVTHFAPILIAAGTPEIYAQLELVHSGAYSND